MKPEILLSEFSTDSRKGIGIICFMICIFLVGIPIILKDFVLLVVLTIVLLPIFLVGVTLIFGKAKSGKGVFSPLTLYLIGILIGVFSVTMPFYGHPSTAMGLFITVACFKLAMKRTNQATGKT